jgi:hypothetical protein
MTVTWSRIDRFENAIFEAKQDKKARKMTKKNTTDEKDFPVPDEFTEKLQKAVENLFYMSETDAEIVTFFAECTGPENSKETVLAATGKSSDSPVEERDFDEFFARLTRVYEGANDQAKATAERFSRLGTLLGENLEDVKVFKVGSIRLDVFVVGRDRSGNLIGIRTFAVET